MCCLQYKTFYFERILKATDVDNIKNYVETHIMLKSYYFQKQILALSSESNWTWGILNKDILRGNWFFTRL